MDEEKRTEEQKSALMAAPLLRLVALLFATGSRTATEALFLAGILLQCEGKAKRHEQRETDWKLDRKAVGLCPLPSALLNRSSKEAAPLGFLFLPFSLSPLLPLLLLMYQPKS